jgi:hypothetical protein
MPSLARITAMQLIKLKYLIDLLKTYQSISGIKLDEIEIKTFMSLVEILRQVMENIIQRKILLLAATRFMIIYA